MNFARPLGSIAIVAALAGLPACAVRAYPPTIGGYGTVYADYVPPDIYAYPHVYYEGGYAYLVGDRWYYPSDGGWVVMRSEPPVLYQYRTGYYREHAPPAYRAYHRGYRTAPPAYGYPPPAVRVR